MSRLIPWLIALGILALAGVVVALEPPEQFEQAPFVTSVEQGQLGTGRNIEATISNVRLAETVDLDTLEGWHGTTEGVWLVADVTAATRVEPSGLTSFLLIRDADGRDLEFRGSERLDTDGIESWRLVPGIPTQGTVLFEIPRELAAATTSAQLRVGMSSDWRLDSLVATTVDLSALKVEKSVLVAPAARVAP